MERLKEIQERCEKATPGPWRGGIHLEPERVIEDLHLDETMYVLGTFPVNDRPECYLRVAVMCGDQQQDADNVSFIAHARQDIPDLLSHIEELERERDGLKRRALSEVTRFYELSDAGNQLAEDVCKALSHGDAEQVCKALEAFCETKERLLAKQGGQEK